MTAIAMGFAGEFSRRRAGATSGRQKGRLESRPQSEPGDAEHGAGDPCHERCLCHAAPCHGSAGGETVDGGRGVALAGAEDGARERGLVGRIREVLRFEAETGARAVGQAAFADADQEMINRLLDEARVRRAAALAMLTA